MDEFNKITDEGLAKVQLQLKYANEKLIKIQADGVIPPQSSMNVYMSMIDRPEYGDYFLARFNTNSMIALPSLRTRISGDAPTT